MCREHNGTIYGQSRCSAVRDFDLGLAAGQARLEAALKPVADMAALLEQPHGPLLFIEESIIRRAAEAMEGKP